MIRRLKQYAIGFDILIVDDGSQDKTREIAKTEGFVVLSHPVKLGYGAAIQTGFRYAVNLGYKTAVIMDADGQHRPEDIASLHERFNETGADLLIGSRLAKGRPPDFPISKLLVMRLFSLIILLATRVRIADCTSGFWVLSRKCFTILSKNCPQNHPDAETLLCLMLDGMQIDEFPVTFDSRRFGRSMFTLSTTIYYPFYMFLELSSLLLTSILKLFIKRRKLA